MSSGKGGSDTTTTDIPDWMKPYVTSNLDRAETTAQIGYQPYYGIDVAAQTPMQTAAYQSGIGAAEAFGLVQPDTLSATAGLPETTTINGVTGYSSAPLYEAAVSEATARNPEQAEIYNSLFGNETAYNTTYQQQLADLQAQLDAINSSSYNTSYSSDGGDSWSGDSYDDFSDYSVPDGDWGGR